MRGVVWERRRRIGLGVGDSMTMGDDDRIREM